MLYECLAGRSPFEDYLGEKGEERYPQLRDAGPSLGFHFHGSREAIALIDRALSDDPASRPTLEEPRDGLRDVAGIDPEAPRAGNAPGSFDGETRL